MGEKEKQNKSCVAERSRTEKERAVWSKLRCEACLSPREGHGDVQTLTATKGHVWTHIPMAAGICVEVKGLCCYRRPHGNQGVWLRSVSLLVSECCARTGLGLRSCCRPGSWAAVCEFVGIRGLCSDWTGTVLLLWTILESVALLELGFVLIFVASVSIGGHRNHYMNHFLHEYSALK